MISVCLSSYYIFQVYKKWDLNPVLIGFDSTPVSIYSIPFPCKFGPLYSLQFEPFFNCTRFETLLIISDSGFQNFQKKKLVLYYKNYFYYFLVTGGFYYTYILRWLHFQDF